MKYLLIILLSLGGLIFLPASSCFGQGSSQSSVALENDTVHSVKRATLLSAALPGAGQVYNGKWWKVPIIYGGLGACAYLAVDNHRQYRKYLDAFYVKIDSNQTNAIADSYSPRALIELQNLYRDWRDLAIIIGGVIYALNIIDSHVDAHLYDYNVNDNLNLRIEPSLFYMQNLPAVGLKLRLTVP